MYRPPNADETYYNKIIDCLMKVSNEEKDFVILGDLNFDYKIDESLRSNPLFMLEVLFSIKQLVDSPTRVTATSSTIIDVILSSCPQRHTTTKVLKYGISDHFMILTKIDISHNIRNHREIRFRNFKQFAE